MNMQPQEYAQLLARVELLCRDAGQAIMAIYHAEQPLRIEQKSDNSPVTQADLAAHEVIKHGLSQFSPHIPQLSEEAPPEWEVRRHWQRYWLIDPLDGTKEFIQRNGEFTVNIALIEQGMPVLGVVYVPVNNVLYAAGGGKAWKEAAGCRQEICVQPAVPPTVVISRSHQDNELKSYLARLGRHRTVTVGSSLKFCLIAEGSAQLYPRFGPTHTWDTAAGHAVALAAGAKVCDWQGKTLDYTAAESLLNPGFKVYLP